MDSDQEDVGGADADALDVVAASLAGGATAEEAGQTVGRSARTVRRWLAETDLGARVAVRRREMIGEIAGGLVSTAIRAAAVLAGKVEDGENSEQLRAALAVLDRAWKFHAAGEVDVRVAQLEARIMELEAEAQAKR